MISILLACTTPDDSGPGHVDTGVEGIPGDTSPVEDTSETGDSADTADTADTGSGSGCGELPLDEAGFASLFDTDTIHTFALTFAPADRDELAADPQHYVPADLTVDGTALSGVGVRMRGTGEAMNWDAKPSFRIDLRKYDNCDAFASVDSLLLDAGDDDPTLAKEFISAQVFAALAIPAPNAAFATVSVDGEAYGLYTHVETVDTHFLAHHGLEAGGTLWEGKDGADFSASGVAQWDDNGAGADPAPIQAVATTVATAGDDFYALADTGVNMEQFLATWAGIAVVGHNRSFPYKATDAYIYAAPSDPRFVVIPWEIDEGWAVDFAWNGVESQLGLRCVYDSTCDDALRSAVLDAAAAADTADVSSIVSDALALSGNAALADSHKSWTDSETTTARSGLESSVATWTDGLRAAIQ